MVVTPNPGKRPALALGIRKAKSKIVALVDSDVIWAPAIKKNCLHHSGIPKLVELQLNKTL